MKIKAVIFDMDGLIIDSESIESQSLEILLKKYGKTPIINAQGLIHTVGAAENKYQDLMRKYRIDADVEIFKKQKRKIFSKLINKKLIPYKGFIGLLKILKKHHVKLALASNRNEVHIKLILNNLGVRDFFDIIIGPSKSRRHKPHPDIYLATAKKLKVSPAECVVLEDSEIGITSAKTAGMKVIAVPNDYTKHHNFTLADLMVSSLEDVKWSTILKV